LLKITSDANKLADEFDELICLLIMSNHVHVWDYGYSFFKTATKMLEAGFKNQALTVVAGVGALFDKQAMGELTRKK